MGNKQNFKYLIMQLFSKLLILFLAINFSACSSDDDNGGDDGGNGGDVTGTFVVTIDGVEQTADFASGLIVNNGNSMLVSANIGQDEISLIFPWPSNAGDAYDVSTGDLFGGYDTGNFQGNVAESGFVSLINHNTSADTITGEFAFTTGPTGPNNTVYTLTNGQFLVEYSSL